MKFRTASAYRPSTRLPRSQHNERRQGPFAGWAQFDSPRAKLAHLWRQLEGGLSRPVCRPGSAIRFHDYPFSAEPPGVGACTRCLKVWEQNAECRRQEAADE